MQKKGESVTVACPKESKLPEGVEQIDIGPEKYTVAQNWAQAESDAYQIYKPKLGDFDIIHDHTWFAYAYMAKADNPKLKIIKTHHGHLNWQTRPPVRYPNLCAISKFMANLYSQQLAIPARPVYNGVAIEEFPVSLERGERLLYVGRIAKFKQPHIAIYIAKRLGLPIDIIGGDRFVDDPAYVSRIKDECNGNLARYIGEVPHDIKLKYLAQCRAVLIPSQMKEPFGLVAVEALATGKPVFCLDDGALKEIVTPDVGFICQSPEDIIGLLAKDKDRGFEPTTCRARAEVFSREHMGEAYRQAYSDILDGREW